MISGKHLVVVADANFCRSCERSPDDLLDGSIVAGTVMAARVVSSSKVSGCGVMDDHRGKTTFGQPGTNGGHPKGSQLPGRSANQVSSTAIRQFQSPFDSLLGDELHEVIVVVAGRLARSLYDPRAKLI